MAKMQVFERLGEYGTLDNYFTFDSDFGLQDGASSSRAIFLDEVTGYRMVVTGTDLDYSNDAISEGSITAIAFSNKGGKKLVTLDNLKTSADGFTSAYDHGASALLKYLLRGNDTLTGSDIADTIKGYAGKNTLYGGEGGDKLFGGDKQDRLFGDQGKDKLLGGAGDDTMTGGKGSDIFVFAANSGRDVITDFDANGGGDKQDYLRLGDHSGSFNVKESGDDVLITFDNSDTIRLINVSILDFDPLSDIKL